MSRKTIIETKVFPADFLNIASNALVSLSDRGSLKVKYPVVSLNEYNGKCIVGIKLKLFVDSANPYNSTYNYKSTGNSLVGRAIINGSKQYSDCVLTKTANDGYAAETLFFTDPFKYNSWFELSTGAASIMFSTQYSGASTIPYVEVNVGDAIFKVINAYPQYGFLNKAVENNFNWENEIVAGDWPLGTLPTYKSALFRYREYGSTAYTEIPVTGSTATLPPNTFKSDKVEWQVVPISNFDVEGLASRWHTLTTLDDISTARCLEPINTTLNNAVTNIFKWEHINNTGALPLKSELEYSKDLINWQPLIIVNSAETTVALPAGTLQTGKMYWRVRTYNLNNIVGKWSEPVAIVVDGVTLPPTISSITTGKARPLISWCAVDQSAYQIQISDINKNIIVFEEQSGGNKKYKVNDYLPDGSYTLNLRIKSDSEFWSELATTTFNIETIKPKKPIITVTMNEFSAKISVLDIAGYSKFYLYKNDTPIAKFSKAYEDFSLLGNTRYFVRAIDNNDNFSDSDIATVNFAIKKGFVIAPIGNLEDITQIYLSKDKDLKTQIKLSPSITMKHFDGRKYPVMESSGYVDETYLKSFSVLDFITFNRIKRLADCFETVLLRDSCNNCFYGVIDSLDYEQNKRSTEANISIVRVDYNDKIDFD